MFGVVTELDGEPEDKGATLGDCGGVPGPDFRILNLKAVFLSVSNIFLLCWKITIICYRRFHRSRVNFKCSMVKPLLLHPNRLYA